jgi:hypothetical protein
LRILDKALKNFQQIYFEKFGESINEDQALEKATKLVSLVDIIRKYENHNSIGCKVNHKEIKK